MFVLFVQDPHDVGYREPVIDEEIANGDFPFRDRVKGCRILRARKHLSGDTEAVSFQGFGQCQISAKWEECPQRRHAGEVQEDLFFTERSREPYPFQDTVQGCSAYHWQAAHRR